MGGNENSFLCNVLQKKYVIVYISSFGKNVQIVNIQIVGNVEMFDSVRFVVEFINTLLYIENTVYEIVSIFFKRACPFPVSS